MPKVYLSPAYHYWNPCAVAGCDETTHNHLYLDVLEPYLAACGIQYKRGPRRTPKSGEDGDALMLQAVRESDAWGADVHYVSHTNAANGGVRGYRPMIYPGSGGGRKLAACILKYRRKIYDQPIRLSESSVWYELRAPAAVSFYEEHVFHDNAADAQWFHSHLGAIAEATCRGLCEYFGIPYRAPGTAKPSPAPTIRKEEQVTVELRMLKRGMEGGDVRSAMLLMKDKGYYPYAIPVSDKLFGAKMEAGLRKMQADHDLGVDGILGAASWGYLLGR